MLDSAILPDTKTIYSYMETVVLGFSSWYVTSALLLLTFVTAMTYIWVTRFWPDSFERTRDVTCPLPLPPGTMGCPYIGETLQFIRKGSDFYKEHLSSYGKVYKTHLLGRPMVRLVGAEHVRPVLLGEHTAVRSCWPTSVQQMVGPYSLLGSSGDTHKLLKNLIGSVFTPEVMASFVPRIRAIIRSHIHHWCQTSSEAGYILGFPACQRMSADLALEIILGAGSGSVSGTGSTSEPELDPDELLTALGNFVANLFSIPIRFPGGGLWKGMKARERILQGVRKKLDQSKTRDDVNFLSIVELLEEVPYPDGTRMREHRKVIEDNALEMFFAGYTTTASALCSALLCLGRHPDVLKKVETELRDQGLLDENPDFTYDVLNGLEYVHCVNREVLRMLPPAGAGFRKVQSTLQIGGFQIPAGWTVAYSIRETQETSAQFPDADRFLPERWREASSEEDDGDHAMKQSVRFHYIPFGSGARRCVGMRLAKLVQAIFLVELVRCSTWTLWSPWPEVKHLPITKPADDLPVTFRPRSTGTETSR